MVFGRAYVVSEVGTGQAGIVGVVGAELEPRVKLSGANINAKAQFRHLTHSPSRQDTYQTLGFMIAPNLRIYENEHQPPR